MLSRLEAAPNLSHPPARLRSIFFGQSCQAAGNFGIWLKFKGASVTKRNLFPTFINYVEIPTIFLWVCRLAHTSHPPQSSLR